MPRKSQSELLMRIGSNPSNSEGSIQEFRTSFSASLTEMRTNLAQWSTESIANFNQVDQSAQTLAGNFKTNVDTVNNILDRNRQMAQLWRAELVASLVDVLNVSQNVSGNMLEGFMRFDSALGANVANAIIWQKSIGDAFTKAAVQAITSIAQESLVRAIQSTALGFYLLAIQDYSGAAAAFEAAAMYGAVGGAAALAGRALASPAGSAAGGSRSSSTGSSNSSNSKNVSASAAAEKNVQVIFQGPVYGGQAGIDELVRHITQAVTERDVNLVAYTVVRQPTLKE